MLFLKVFWGGLLTKRIEVLQEAWTYSFDISDPKYGDWMNSITREEVFHPKCSLWSMESNDLWHGLSNLALGVIFQQSHHFSSNKWIGWMFLWELFFLEFFCVATTSYLHTCLHVFSGGWDHGTLPWQRNQCQDASISPVCWSLLCIVDIFLEVSLLNSLIYGIPPQGRLPPRALLCGLHMETFWGFIRQPVLRWFVTTFGPLGWWQSRGGVVLKRVSKVLPQAFPAARWPLSQDHSRTLNPTFLVLVAVISSPPK